VSAAEDDATAQREQIDRCTGLRDAPPSSRVLAFAAAVEVGTGLVLIAAPALVVGWLLGVEISAAGTLLGRC
jgi:hypothetical protein